MLEKIEEGCQLYVCYSFSVRSLGNEEVSNNLGFVWEFRGEENGME
jgi:hypothetical protein